jgi:hypothetical protein
MIKLALKLEKQLESHDWFYEYSDDQRYWGAGVKEQIEINDTMKEMTEAGYGELALSMYKKHKPKLNNHEQRVDSSS